MTALDVGEGVLRAFGAVYALAAVFMLNQLRMSHFLDRAIDQIERMAADLGGGETRPRAPVDLVRNYWLGSGAVLLFAAGVTMALGLRVSVVTLALVAVHQMAYFIRQRRRELAATTEEARAEARPEQSTRNGFLTGLVMLVLAAWLERAGVLT